MTENYQSDQSEVVIKNQKNFEHTQPSSLPDVGPYAIRIRDMQFNEDSLLDLFNELEIKHKSIQTREYVDNIKKITFYTFFIVFEELRDAAIVLGLNNIEWENSKISALYLQDYHHNSKYNKDEQGQVNHFKNMRDLKGSEVKDAPAYVPEKFSLSRDQMGSKPKEEHYQPPALRNMFGQQATEKKTEFDTKPMAFSRNDFGQATTQQPEQPKQSLFGFRRDDMGTNIDTSKDQQQSKKKYSSKPPTVLDFSRSK